MATWRVPAAPPPPLLRHLRRPQVAVAGVVHPAHIWMSTDSRAVNVVELRALLAATGQNCDQFPRLNADGNPVRVDPVRLKLALNNSFLIVAAYVNGLPEGMDYMERRCSSSSSSSSSSSGDSDGFFWQRKEQLQQPVPKCLVAFGRAVSDGHFAASIHDLAVAPSMQRLGIGRRVLQRIVSPLAQRGIGDISVLASPGNTAFFARCGFGPDVLCSTTMLYTKTGTTRDNGKCFGRVALLVPPLAKKKAQLLARRTVGGDESQQRTADASSLAR